MEIRFHGATRTVTGSLHEIRAGGKTFLLDCGMFQGPRELARKINCCFDFDVKSVDFVVLSHGHTDHCANLPNLVKLDLSENHLTELPKEVYSLDKVTLLSP